MVGVEKFLERINEWVNEEIEKHEVFKPSDSCSAWELCYLGPWTFWCGTQSWEGKHRDFSPRGEQRALIRVPTESATSTWERNPSLSVQSWDEGAWPRTDQEHTDWERRSFSSNANWALHLFPISRWGECAASPDTGLIQSSEGHFKKSRLFWGPEKGSGENVSEAEIYQQNRPEETCHQLGTKGITGIEEQEDGHCSWFLNECDGSHPFGKYLLYQAGPWRIIEMIFISFLVGANIGHNSYWVHLPRSLGFCLIYSCEYNVNAKDVAFNIIKLFALLLF